MGEVIVAERRRRFPHADSLEEVRKKKGRKKRALFARLLYEGRSPLEAHEEAYGPDWKPADGQTRESTACVLSYHPRVRWYLDRWNDRKPLDHLSDFQNQSIDRLAAGLNAVNSKGRPIWSVQIKCATQILDRTPGTCKKTAAMITTAHFPAADVEFNDAMKELKSLEPKLLGSDGSSRTDAVSPCEYVQACSVGVGVPTGTDGGRARQEESDQTFSSETLSGGCDEVLAGEQLGAGGEEPAAHDELVDVGAASSPCTLLPVQKDSGPEQDGSGQQENAGSGVGDVPASSELDEESHSSEEERRSIRDLFW